jgi:hypothetical protein
VKVTPLRNGRECEAVDDELVVPEGLAIIVDEDGSVSVFTVAPAGGVKEKTLDEGAVKLTEENLAESTSVPVEERTSNPRTCDVDEST